jgi:8-oxo-dGTP pyrophosphatase MutT (NUDIX family)
MLEFEILAKGSFSVKTLRVQYHPNVGRMPVSDDVEVHLNRNWERHMMWTSSNNLELCNDQLLRLVAFGKDDKTSELSLHLSLTDYREFVGTRCAEFFNNKNYSQLSNPLGASAVVITSDNKILCGKRPAHANINPGKYFLVGGFLTPEDLEVASDLFRGICREIYEETGIPYSSHRTTWCTGLVYDLVKPHPELCFSTHVIEDFATVCSYQPEEKEVVILEYIENTADSIGSWLLNLHPARVVNTAEGSLLLHGLQKFGESWFKSTCSLLEDKLLF